MKRIIALLIAILLILPVICHGQGRVMFDGIPLGTDYKTFVKALKARGFEAHLERNGEEHIFYGVCKEGFFVGEVDGNPAAIKVIASHKTETVFSVDVNLRRFIDIEEAVEAADRLLADERAKVPVYKSELYRTGLDISFVDMPGGEKRVTKYMCYPKAGLMQRFYNRQDQVEKNESYGSMAIIIYENSLGHEYIVHVSYYDIAAGRMAESESGKGKS